MAEYSTMREIGTILIRNRDTNKLFWKWLVPGKPLSKKCANKFLLAAIIDYQTNAEHAWQNVANFAEYILGDPGDLWGTITSCSLEEWKIKHKLYSLHRYPKAHERVYRIGNGIIIQYKGDARNIWKNQSIDALMYRLNNLGVGPQISRMIAGALNDAKIVKGKGDVKIDTHIRRIIGRIIQGKINSPLSDHEILQLTNEMWPNNPWLLDRPLFQLGRNICRALDPKCVECYLRPKCQYFKSYYEG